MQPTITAQYGLRQLTPGRIAAALVVAGLADLIQLPVTLASLTGLLTVPVEVADLLIDCAVCGVLTLLLGWHWLLLPAFAAEAVPFLDVFPTWTVTVAALVAIRHREARRMHSDAATTDVVPTTRAVVTDQTIDVTALRVIDLPSEEEDGP